MVKRQGFRKKVLEAGRATEMHMALSCIAMGLLQKSSVLARSVTRGHLPKEGVLLVNGKYESQTVNIEEPKAYVSYSVDTRN